MNVFERLRRLAYTLEPPNNLTPQLVGEANTAEIYCNELRARVTELEAGIRDALHLLDEQGGGSPTENALVQDLSNLLKRRQLAQ